MSLGTPLAAVLVDTSAWISFFARTGSTALKRRIGALLDEDQVAIAGPIVLELLQGCRSVDEHAKIEGHVRALRWLPLEDRHWYMAGAMAFQLRRLGVTVGAVDAVIATLAESHGCPLLHQDRDFEHIARHTRLQLLRV